ncbi:extracellular solute-binding protein [Bacillaceae bacterium SIJ1]|uniref:extracellular solute-binding protein n=1 Tax=Litoribacterium kuwaitense TaxID=1398745 RepID=UPI0013ECCA75|nr:extracellular solute-binding protein [Litoribacterium kuwaitense]NGP43828.1 extracellular solute-binding protein [Litoribacterium kuwaitense]
MKSYKGIVSASVLTFSLVLSGCSSSNPEESGAEAVSSNFNESGLPIVEEDITLEIAGKYDARTGSDWNELETFKEINEGTNVNIDWKLSPGSDWTQKRNLMIASGDLPDVILKLSPSDVVMGGSQGIFIPLEDMIDKYAPNLTAFLDENPEVRDAITAPDGHIYSLPMANMSKFKRSSGNTLWINEKWLEKIGMDMPETTDEFYEALQAFKEQDMNGNGDPNDEIPLSGIYGDSLHGFNFLFGSFGTIDETFLVKGDKVEFVRTSPEYKEVIKYLSSLYQNGLLDQETFTLEGSAFLSKLAAGDKANVGAFFGWSPDQITNPDYKWDYKSPIHALKGPEGHQVRGYLNPQLDQATFAITKGNQHPEATIRWVDRAYDPDMSFKLRQGPNRVEKLDNGKYGIVDPPEGFTAGEWRVKETPYNSFVYGFSQKMREQMDLSNLKPGVLDPDKDEWFDLQEPKLKNWIYPQILFTKQQYDDITRYQTDIMAYTDEMAAKWITGTADVEADWEKYVENLKKMGLDDFTQIYQDGYDTYQENTQ